MGSHCPVSGDQIQNFLSAPWSRAFNITYEHMVVGESSNLASHIVPDGTPLYELRGYIHNEKYVKCSVLFAQSKRSRNCGVWNDGHLTSSESGDNNDLVTVHVAVL